MRILPFLLYFIVVLAIGCTEEGDKIYNSYNYYYPEDTTQVPPDSLPHISVQIDYPARNEVIEIEYDWVEADPPNGYTCPWGYSADSVIYAEVTTNIARTVLEARVFIRAGSSGGYSQYYVQTFPVGTHFFIRVYDRHSNYSSYVPPEQELQFWVSLMTDDSVNYISPTIPFRVLSSVNYEMETVPLPPFADTLREPGYQQRMEISWCPGSPNAESYRISIRNVATGEVNFLSVENAYYSASYLYYQPITEYSVWINAENSHGVSAASDTMRLTTHAPIMPDNFTASVTTDPSVNLHWYNNAYPGSILISRRDTLSGWSTVSSLPCEGSSCYNSYADTSMARSMVHYYRLGLQYPNGIWWGEDSVGVWIP